MHKIFRNTLLGLPAKDQITAYYWHNESRSLMISEVGDDGELRNYESGRILIVEPMAAADPVVRAYTLDDNLRIAKQEIAEEGYVEISEEAFMDIVNEKYPGWREKEPEPELKPSELAKRRLAERRAKKDV